MKATSFGALAAVAVLQATRECLSNPTSLVQYAMLKRMFAVAAAQTSLYVPGFDPQALTVDIEGVDAQGRTTYLIGPGASSGTFYDNDGLVGTGTSLLTCPHPSGFALTPRPHRQRRSSRTPPRRISST